MRVTPVIARRMASTRPPLPDNLCPLLAMDPTAAAAVSSGRPHGGREDRPPAADRGAVGDRSVFKVRAGGAQGLERPLEHALGHPSPQAPGHRVPTAGRRVRIAPVRTRPSTALRNRRLSAMAKSRLARRLAGPQRRGPRPWLAAPPASIQDGPPWSGLGSKCPPERHPFRTSEGPQASARRARLYSLANFRLNQYRRSFNGAKYQQAEELLQTLVALGQARALPGQRYGR